MKMENDEKKWMPSLNRLVSKAENCQPLQVDLAAENVLGSDQGSKLAEVRRQKLKPGTLGKPPRRRKKVETVTLSTHGVGGTTPVPF